MRYSLLKRGEGKGRQVEAGSRAIPAILRGCWKRLLLGVARLQNYLGLAQGEPMKVRE